MICPNCNKENDEKKIFCENCGYRLKGQSSGSLSYLDLDKTNKNKKAEEQKQAEPEQINFPSFRKNANTKNTKTNYVGAHEKTSKSSADRILENNENNTSGCAAAAWTDILLTKNWVKKLALAGICNVIPIANFAVAGHGQSWGIEAAKNMNTQLDNGIFDNNKLKLGFFEWLSWFVYGLVFIVAASLLNSVLSKAIFIGSFVLFLLFVASIFYNSFISLAVMKCACDDNLGSSFQLNQIWAVWKKNVGQVFSLYIFPSLICKCIALLFSMIMILFFAAGQLPQIIMIVNNISYITTNPSIIIQLIQLVSSLSFCGLLCYIAFAFMNGIEKIIRYRALGKFINIYAPQWVNKQ